MLPIQTGVGEIVAKRDRDTARNCNRVDAGSSERVVEQASGSELRERVELGLACGAVSDTGVFVDVFERREKPEFVLDDGTADRGEIILPRERLFGIGRGIVNREARVEKKFVPLFVVMTTEAAVVRPVSASSCAVRIANSSIASGEKFWRKPPIQSSVLSAPSTLRSLFKPELPPVDTAVIRALVGSEGSRGSVPGAR